MGGSVGFELDDFPIEPREEFVVSEGNKSANNAEA